MTENILFDLDGTLTDPEEGIINSVIYALKYFSISVDDRKSLYDFIGPPLTDSFEKHFAFSEAQALKAVDVYREYFADKGIFENRVYTGTENMLKCLKSSGKRIVLATSKPEKYAVMILEHFGLLKYFDFVCGATMDERRSSKTAVIEYTLKKTGLSAENSVMVGDRRFDIEGAHENGLKAVGVLYGYGSREELQAAGADFTAESIAELESLLLKL